MSNTTDQNPDAPADRCNANFADVASELAATLATAEDAALMDLPMGDAKASSLPVGVYGVGKFGEGRFTTAQEQSAEPEKPDTLVDGTEV